MPDEAPVISTVLSFVSVMLCSLVSDGTKRRCFAGRYKIFDDGRHLRSLPKMMVVIYNVKAARVTLGAVMRVTREQAAENRERIVAAASRLFREKGFDGIGVDAIMDGVGLTHGGFYRHFQSKEALAA